IRIVRAGPEVGHSPSTIDRSLVEAAAIERQTDPEASRANGQGSQAIEVEQSRFPMTPESAVWNGEVKAPSPEEALCCLLPRDNGRLRVGILGGILIGVPAIAWWAGVLDARRFLNSDTAPAPLQQIALPESAPIKIDKQIISKTTDAQTPSTAGSEPGSKAGESE